MSAYLQMGHDTENLVGEEDLEEFRGVVLSPVNREPSKLQQNVSGFKEKGDYHVILDPQLYFPRGKREKLLKQPYFPQDFDTAEFSSPAGWSAVIDKLASFAEDLDVDAVASPVLKPRKWTDEFYDISVETSKNLGERLSNRIEHLTTCIVALNDLADIDRAKQVASIMTRHETQGFYIVVDADLEPRRELSHANGLLSLMVLIKLLSENAPVTIAYSSSDMILFKAAGAQHCGTSKYFNLRRFTLSRFEAPPSSGGGQLSYWFEHNLLAFLREADIKRLKRYGYADLIGGGHSGSEWGQKLLQFLDEDPGKPWLGMSWRQYLSWFGKTEGELKTNKIDKVRGWLKRAEANWRTLEDDDILMDEPQNDGSWIRPWRQAMRDFIDS